MSTKKTTTKKVTKSAKTTKATKSTKSSRAKKDPIKELTDQLSKSTGAKVIFGDAVKHNGVTLIPVSKLRIVGGGGMGEEPGKQTKGKGMGLGLHVENIPIGYIKIKDDDVQFEPIIDTNKIAIAGILVSGLAALAAVRLWRK